MTSYRLLTGETIDLAGLPSEGRQYLEELRSDAAGKGVDYFDLLRRVKGPSAFLLDGGRITPMVAASLLYRVAHDVADRIGIEQGYVLAPDTVLPDDLEEDLGLLSLTEAADLIGITRPATHEAIRKGRLRGRRIGNAWVVRRDDAQEYRRSRDGAARSNPKKSTTEEPAPSARQPARRVAGARAKKAAR